MLACSLAWNAPAAPAHTAPPSGRLRHDKGLVGGNVALCQKACQRKAFTLHQKVSSQELGIYSTHSTLAANIVARDAWLLITVQLTHGVTGGVAARRCHRWVGGCSRAAAAGAASLRQHGGLGDQQCQNEGQQAFHSSRQLPTGLLPRAARMCRPRPQGCTAPPRNRVKPCGGCLPYCTTQNGNRYCCRHCCSTTKP